MERGPVSAGINTYCWAINTSDKLMLDVSKSYSGNTYLKYIPVVLDSKFSMAKMDTAEWYAVKYTRNKPLSYIVSNNNRYAMVYTLLDGCAVLGIWYKFTDDMYVFYARMSLISYINSTACKYVGSMMTDNYRSIVKTNIYNLVRYYDIRNELVLKIVKGQFKRERISEQHHTLLRPEEILSIVEGCVITNVNDKIESIIINTSLINNIETVEKIYVINCIITKAEVLDINIEATIASIILWILQTDIWCVRLFHHIINKSRNYDELNDWLKLEGRLSKQMQGIIRDNMNQIFELNVLMNRRDKQIDWDKEIHNRVNCTNVLNVSYSDVKMQAKRIFEQGLINAKLPKKQNWQEYWEVRWATMPVGSFVSQYETDMREKESINDRRMANKTTVLSSVGNRDFSYYACRNPEIYSTASTKYEWGKVRALYGCDITSFLMADFSMGNCEELLPGYFPVGEMANEDKIKTIFNGMRKGIPVCYDYDDFNSQHSVSSMTAVIDAWILVYGKFLSSEQLQAACWTFKSIKNMFAKINDKVIKVEGTLFSGWRLTSFMNTVLNRIYMNIAGFEQEIMYAIHNGDDVFAITEYMHNARDLICRCNRIGIRAQTSKMSIGTIAEFLRIDNFAKNSTGSQYITRACATATHSKIESEAAISLEAALNATNDRMKALIVRGGKKEIVIKIEELMIRNYCKLFNTDYDVARMYYRLHPVQGGCNTSAEIQKVRLIKSKYGNMNNKNAEVLAKRMMLGAGDYVRYVARTFNVPIEKISFDEVLAANKEMVRSELTTMVITTETRKEVHYYKAAYKAHKTKKTSANIAKARLLNYFGLNISNLADAQLMRYIQRVDNPLEFVRFIT